MDRRHFLGASGGVLSTLAGCPGRSTPSPEASSTDSSTGGSSCTDDLDHVSVGAEVKSGPLAGFALEVFEESVTFGSQLTVSLKNVTETERTSGNKQDYDVQRQTDAGWKSVFWRPKTGYWTDEALSHAPGEGFTWRLSFTQKGLRSLENQPAYYVCLPLETGTYRFVYFGISPKQESDFETEFALGSSFTVTQR